MNVENEQKFITEFPTQFRDHCGDPEDTCMVWGVETCDGWFDLLYKLCCDIKTLDPEGTFKFEQIKEKFGQLRIYASGTSKEINGLIDKAERDSAGICEVCGTTENVTLKGSWVKALCDKCRK